MNHSELCPVCKGTGKVDEKRCHGCNGLGWVTVVDGQPVMPFLLYPYVWPWPDIAITHTTKPPGE